MEASVAPIMIPALLGRAAEKALSSLNDEKGWDASTVFLNSDDILSVRGSLGRLGVGGVTYESILIGRNSDKVSVDPGGKGVLLALQTNLVTLSFNADEAVFPFEGTSASKIRLGGALGFGLDFGVTASPTGVSIRVDGLFGYGAYTNWGGIATSVPNTSPWWRLP